MGVGCEAFLTFKHHIHLLSEENLHSWVEINLSYYNHDLDKSVGISSHNAMIGTRFSHMPLCIVTTKASKTGLNPLNTDYRCSELTEN